MKKVLNWGWNILQLIIIVYVILVTALLFFENKYGFSQFGNYIIHNVNKLDTKNIPGVKDGDLLIIKVKSKLKVGDRAYYYAAHNDSYVIVTDIVTDIDQDGENYLYTIDDKNPVIISSVRVIGNKISTYPVIGKILATVESRMGFIFFVLLPIMIVFAYQVYQFFMILRYEKVVELAEANDSVIDDEIL